MARAPDLMGVLLILHRAVQVRADGGERVPFGFTRADQQHRLAAELDDLAAFGFNICTLPATTSLTDASGTFGGIMNLTCGIKERSDRRKQYRRPGASASGCDGHWSSCAHSPAFKYAMRSDIWSAVNLGHAMSFSFMRSSICGPWRHSVATMETAEKAPLRPARLGAPLAGSLWQAAQFFSAKDLLPVDWIAALRQVAARPRDNSQSCRMSSRSSLGGGCAIFGA